jgi:hypothetical protein
VSQSRQVQPGERRTAPPPREADDRLVTAAITVGWALALVVLVAIRNQLPPDARWWLWTCVAGIAMGLFGLWYVPVLKRGRARAAASHDQLSEPDSGYESRDNGSNTVSSTDTPGSSTRS